MLIESLSLLSLKVPLHTPFKTALREVTHIHDIVVKLNSSSGLVGYGSAPSTPQITGDDHASIVKALEAELQAIVLGQPLSNFNNICKKISQCDTAGSNAKAALDIALFDLYAQSKKLPLFDLLRKLRAHKLTKAAYKGESSPKLETDYTISVNDVEQMCHDIDKAVKRGYRCLKIKIGNHPQQDLQRLITIARYTEELSQNGVQISLRLDVNQGWDAKTTVSIMNEIEHLGIRFELVEQPVEASDIEGLAFIKENIKTPIMADESAFSLKQVKYLHQTKAVDIINIKLVKAGGLYPAMQIADYCAKHDILCMIGCMLEGSVGVGAAAHLAAAYPDVIRLIDLDGPTLGQYNPLSGATTFEDASITLNTSYGLGIDSTLDLPLWGAA